MGTLLALLTLTAISQQEQLLNAATHLTPSADQVTAKKTKAGVEVTIQPGKEDYPGVGLSPYGTPWNLAHYGHVAAKVVNTGKKPINLSLRVDNAGNWRDNPWNTESTTLAPGASGQIQTLFGYSYGLKPGYKLDPSKVTRVFFFTTKSDDVQTFRIETVVSAGAPGETPPVAPDDVRTKPKDGILPAVRPDVGRWDLRDYDAVRVTFRNTGDTETRPRVRLVSNGGTSEWATSTAPIKPGATGEVTVPFAGTIPLDIGKKTGGAQITSDAVSEITLDSSNTVSVDKIQALTLPAELPAWLGKRPPVPGNWIKTLSEEFTAPKLDPKIWSIYGENYWDKSSHWSKDNVLLGNGVVRLRYQKKRGHNNDDPTKPESPYASGYLHTYGLWTQRYGYFEARMKLPRAPGLWPAFWMMPDRGVKSGEQWQRQDTANGGMEFDILEHLTRWGGRRTNIAVHYDGYDKDHKSIGTDKIYAHPDKDGYLVAGLLWLPGSAVWYMNGHEVARWDSPRVSNVPSIIMFTLPMGGWDNSPLDDAHLPDDFTIDYVRAWQRKR